MYSSVVQIYCLAGFILTAGAVCQGDVDPWSRILYAFELFLVGLTGNV